MKKLFIIFVFIVTISSLINCIKEKNAITQSEKHLWTVPTEESFIIFFRLFDEIKLDSLIAGNIQYRLDLAKTIDPELLAISPLGWELGVIFLGVDLNLYDNFDTTTSRFNYIAIDTLLDKFELVKGVKRYKSSRNGYIKLSFYLNYNIRFLPEFFESIPGVNSAFPSALIPYPGYGNHIDLKINNNIYLFHFYSENIDLNYVRYWLIKVIDDRVKLLSEWERDYIQNPKLN